MAQPELKAKLSVVLPTYNRAALLGRSIASVLGQSFEDFELVVVDDGSTDGTAALLTGLDDPRIVVCRLETNQGYARALNAGVARARSPLIAFQDSDDVWRADKLETQFRLMQLAAPDVAVVYSAFTRLGPGGEEALFPPAWVEHRAGGLDHELLKGNFIGASTAVVRREVFLELGGFDPEMPCLQDWDFWLRLGARYRFAYCPERLATVHVTPASLNQSGPLLSARALEHILSEHAAAFERHRGIMAKHEHSVGHWLMLAGEPRAARAHLWRAFKLRPTRLKYAARALVAQAVPRAY